MATYKVLRAFRMPKTGGMYVPYRIYEVGVDLTSQDMDVWDLGPETLATELTFLVENGTLVFVSQAMPQPTPAEQTEIKTLEAKGLVVPAPAPAS